MITRSKTERNRAGRKQSLRTNYMLRGIAQPHNIVKQICFPKGNVLFLSLFSLFKN